MFFTTYLTFLILSPIIFFIIPQALPRKLRVLTLYSLFFCSTLVYWWYVLLGLLMNLDGPSVIGAGVFLISTYLSSIFGISGIITKVVVIRHQQSYGDEDPIQHIYIWHGSKKTIFG
jgi:hypothetical protein